MRSEIAEKNRGLKYLGRAAVLLPSPGKGDKRVNSNHEASHGCRAAWPFSNADREANSEQE